MTNETTDPDAADEEATIEEQHPYAGKAASAFHALTFRSLDGVLVFLWLLIGKPITKINRLSGGIGKRLLNAGMKFKLGKHDAIVNVIYGDGVVIPYAATYMADRKAFKTTNGDYFSTKGIGFNPSRFNGKVPVVWALRIGTEITEPLEAAITNARKHDRYQQFVRTDGEPDVAVDVDPNNYDAGPGVGQPPEQAVTDGGQVAQQQGATLAGTVLSFKDAYEMFGSKVTQEEMQQQETRGKLSVLDWSRRDQMKLIIFIIVAFCLGLFGPSIAAQLGSAGGSAIQNGASGFGLWMLPGVGF